MRIRFNVFDIEPYGLKPNSDIERVMSTLECQLCETLDAITHRHPYEGNWRARDNRYVKKSYFDL